MKPGATQLTVMLRLPNSRANARSCLPATRLGCGVIGLARVTRCTHYAGNGDDAPVTLLHHGFDDSTAHAKHGFQVGVDHDPQSLVLQTHGQRGSW